jgi:uncharacterized membrane protein
MQSTPLSLLPADPPATPPTGEAYPARDPFPWSDASIGIALLAAMGASVGLFIADRTIPTAGLTQFLTKNVLEATARKTLLFGVVGGAAGPVMAALIAMAWKGRAAVESVRRVGGFLSPLALLFMVPSLLASKTWHETPLPYLVQLALFGLAAERAFATAIAAFPPWMGDASVSLASRIHPKVRRYAPMAVVLAGAIAYSAYFSFYTLRNHWKLGTAAFDLGIYVNWCYNILHGNWFRTTVLFGPDGGNMIAGHAVFACLFLWTPVFAITRTAEALLIYQACIIGFAAVPLYLFASTQIPRWSAVLVALAFLLYAPLHGPNFYDFHELLVSVFWYFWLFWGIATYRNWVVALTVFVLYAHREDVAVGIAVLGTFMMFVNVRPKLGGLLAGLSVFWFVLDKFVIMPWAGTWWFANLYEELIPEGKGGYGAIVQTMLVNPVYLLGTMVREAKLIYLGHVFVPLLFLPARRWIVLMLAASGFMFTIVTTNYAPTVSIAFHYTTHLTPYLFAGCVLVMREMLRAPNGFSRSAGAAMALAATVFFHSWVFGAVFNHESFVGGFQRIDFTYTDADKARYAELKRIAAMIPQSASVGATENECPHIAARIDAYTLRDYHGDAEYLFINKNHMSLGNTRRTIQSAFSRNAYGLYAQGDVFYLFKKGHVAPGTDTAKQALGI